MDGPSGVARLPTGPETCPKRLNPCSELRWEVRLGRCARAPPRIPRRCVGEPSPRAGVPAHLDGSRPTVAGQRRTWTGFPHTRRLRSDSTTTAPVASIGTPDTLPSWRGHGV